MPSYSGSSSQHKTLTASTVDTVTLDGDYDNVEVLNRGTTGEIYGTVGGSSAAPADPTVGGAGTFVVLAGQGLVVPVGRATGNTVVKLISSSGLAYSVTAVTA